MKIYRFVQLKQIVLRGVCLLFLVSKNVLFVSLYRETKMFTPRFLPAFRHSFRIDKENFLKEKNVAVYVCDVCAFRKIHQTNLSSILNVGTWIIRFLRARRRHTVIDSFINNRHFVFFPPSSLVYHCFYRHYHMILASRVFLFLRARTHSRTQTQANKRTNKQTSKHNTKRVINN